VLKDLKKVFLIVWSDRRKEPLRFFRKSYARWRKKGWSEVVRKLNDEYDKLNLEVPIEAGRTDEAEYKMWIDKNESDILKTEKLNYEPYFSIITPVYNTEPKFLKNMFESVLAQTYGRWELCVADDASNKKETLDVLREYESIKNIKIVFRQMNGHICRASNSALEMATGDYLIFLDHDDMLAPNALYEMAKTIDENRKLKLIYSDEDKIDENNNRFQPHFKSGWNPDMFFSQNYICHLVCLRKDIVDRVGGFREGFEGSQDYDLLLRALDYVDDSEIAHIEKILYHWRAVKGSTAYHPDEKKYAHNSGLKALRDYFAKKDLRIVVEDGLLPTTYKVTYPIHRLSSKDYRLTTNDYPLVSLLIPTRDGYDILHKCIESIRQKTLYPNYEIIVIDNETTCPKTLDYFEKIKSYKNVTILEYHKPFNYSAINNFGVKHAKGEIIGLINNDIEIISDGWLTEMVQHALRPEIGAVGAKLYYNNDTIQHAGVVLGIGGVAGHSHKYFPKDVHGYFSRLKIIQNYSAVTGACLLVKKELYEEVGGLNETDLKVAFNDVDFCLKLLEKGYRNLWTPYAEAYHHESISRGAEDDPEKVKRFNQEVEYMKKKWGNILKYDNCYNSNLTKKYENFRISIQ